MKAIVHIGTEKTGTTSIQEFLYKNRDQLKNNGFYFIQSAGERNNRALVAYCLNEEKHDDFFQDRGIKSLEEKNDFKYNFYEEFKNEIESIPDSIDTVIISSEHFHSRTNSRNEVENVYKLLSSFFTEIKIVCYIREQVATCTSYYSTTIKCGGYPSFNEFIRGCEPGNIYYNHFEMLLNWEIFFGLGSLDISLYNKDEFFNGNLLDDFTVKLDKDLVGKLNTNISIENESLTYAGQVLGKAVNKAIPRYLDGVRINTLREKCQEVINRECKGRGEQPSLDIQKEIYEKFIESNEKLRQKFFPERGILFDPPSEEAKTNKFINDEFVGILSNIFTILMGEEKGIVLSDRYADLFRDAAIKIENEDLQSAYELMVLAHKIRPSGSLIKQKLDEYHQILS